MLGHVPNWEERNMEQVQNAINEVARLKAKLEQVKRERNELHQERDLLREEIFLLIRAQKA